MYQTEQIRFIGLYLIKGCKNYSSDSLVIQQAASVIEAQDDAFVIELNSILEAANITENDVLNNIEALSVSLMTEPEKREVND